MTDAEKYKKKYIGLKKAVKKWVMGEFRFRLGSNAFSNETAKDFIDAQGELRSTLTGLPGLWDAATVIDEEVVATESKAVKKDWQKRSSVKKDDGNKSLRRKPKKKVRKTK